MNNTNLPLRDLVFFFETGAREVDLSEESFGIIRIKKDEKSNNYEMVLLKDFNSSEEPEDHIVQSSLENILVYLRESVNDFSNWKACYNY